MKWTEGQKAAIDTKNCKLLVAAGAGSGKTAVLVQRIIDKIIIDKIDIDKMLIVTFTNAAASEMRERIRDGLYKALETNPEIKEQLLLINKASIMTIDAFCKKVIQDNFYKINLDPNFRVADSAENELLKLEALDEVFNVLYEENNEDVINVMNSYSNNKSDDALKEIILSIHSFIQSSPFPYEWLKEKCEMYNLDEKDFANTVWGKEIILYAQGEIKGIYDEMKEMVDDLLNNNEATNYVLTLQSDISLLEKLLYNCSTWDDYITYLSVCEIAKLKSAPKLDDETKEEVKELREKMKAIVKKYLKEEIFIMNSEEIFKDISKLYKTLKILSDIVIKFDMCFKEKKKNKGIIDFSDMEHMCLELLNNNESIASGYREKYEEILIDEYQDSNLIQEFILNKISNGHMFMVGDVKQSIYKFRQARPELFLEKYETYTEDLSSDSPTKKILLFKNFRSNENIIDQANFVFKNAMTKAVGEIDYTEKEYLKFGASYYPCEGTKAEIDLIEKKPSEELDEEIEDDIEDTPQLEGRVIAKRIEEMVGNFDVYDKKTGQMRKARYSDIVILLRATKGYAEIFVSELAKREIPAFADVNSGYFENTEVQIILSLLKIINNPYQDIPLLAVMRSPIANFNVDELTNIRLIDKTSSYYEALQKATSTNQKVKDFIEKLDKWREKSKHMALDEFIMYIYEETSFCHFVSLLPNGAERVSNLKTLVEKATAYDKTSYRGLFNFINFLDNLKESSGDMGSSTQLSENDDVVRIMSIHKSKGLEFPVVFLSGTNRKFNLRDMSNPIIFHQDLGFGADIIDTEKRIYYSSMPKLALKLKAKRETLSEEMRILYVALTRPREKLIITALESDIAKKREKWSKKLTEYKIASSNNFADWLCLACINNEKDFVVNEWFYADVLKLSKEEMADLSYAGTVLKDIDYSLKNTDDYKFINDRLNWKYKYANSLEIPNKLTVSMLKTSSGKISLKSFENKINVLVEKPQFMLSAEEKNMKGSDYGTLIHSIMQKLDFKNPNISEIVQNLEIEDSTKKILEKQINDFLQTPFYEKVKKAEKIYKEVPFNLDVKAGYLYEIQDESEDDIIKLEGVIDMYFETDEEITLLDYKTDKVKNEIELIEKYKMQLEYYKMALERLTNKKVTKMYIYSFCLKKEIEVS